MNNSNMSRFLEKTEHPKERETCSFILIYLGELSLENESWNGGHYSSLEKRKTIRLFHELGGSITTPGSYCFKSQLFLLCCQRKTSQYLVKLFFFPNKQAAQSEANHFV